MKRSNVLFIGLLMAVLILSVACTKTPTQVIPTDNTGNQQSSGTQGTTTIVNTSTNTQTTGTDGTVITTTNTSSTTQTSATVKELDIEAYSFGFNVLNSVQINKGDNVKIVLTSKSGTHGLSMPDFNVNMGPVSPGESKTAEFIADKSGTFTYFCNVPCGPGHSSMRSTLTVT